MTDVRAAFRSSHGDARSAAHSLFHTDKPNHDKLRLYIDQQEAAEAERERQLLELQQLYAAFDGSGHAPKNPREARLAIDYMAHCARCGATTDMKCCGPCCGAMMRM